MQSGKKKQLFNEINITPLTDIFLVLLIIMMVVAPMLDTTGLKLAVPSDAPATEKSTEPKLITIKISKSGGYQVNNQRVSAIELSAKLNALKRDFPDGVAIKSSPDASHSVLTLAMDSAQKAGIRKVSVMLDSGT
ncbi:MAG: biopolymer transporter ExbD [Cyanobacteria bacterium P01_H01_bin.74]